ncbi:MAG: peptidoglycan DD-metalloendopeptidase family protein [Lachnospiraceae bacterium]|nr:peptidoglycan DD-metalloendopeptidase family protein [Lachnospiraceae bacterium]
MEVNLDNVAKKNILFPENTHVAEKKTSIRIEAFVLVVAAALFLFLAELIHNSVLSSELEGANKSISELNAQLQEIKAENRQIALENEELQEKVVILSDTINDGEKQAKELAQSRIPSGFPLKGTASLDSDTVELDGEPIASFVVSPGTGVIATANGVVSSIAGSKGSGYIIMVDHQNGYYSVYRNGSTPKVSEGDEVTKATELFEIEVGHMRFGYQIIQENKYINPLDLMETYG